MSRTLLGVFGCFIPGIVAAHKMDVIAGKAKPLRFRTKDEEQTM